jgi:hypothetical protein
MSSPPAQTGKQQRAAHAHELRVRLRVALAQADQHEQASP